MNPEVNWDKNYILNGDFEFETIPNNQKLLTLDDIPNWTSTDKY